MRPFTIQHVELMHHDTHRMSPDTDAIGKTARNFRKTGLDALRTDVLANVRAMAVLRRSE